MVKTIAPQAFDMELLSHDGPFLVAFLKRNERYGTLAGILDRICDAQDDSFRCYLYNADYLDTAMERFSVEGTPTFVLFRQGQEVDRLIGDTDEESLNEFIRNTGRQ